MDIRIGTSGFQYPEWKGKFYPAGWSVAKMLPFYAERFSTTEINYSFRRIPSERTVAGWKATTPAGFAFSLKAPQKVTHFAKLRHCAETVEFFWKAVRGLDEKLGCVLFQLPPTLAKDEALLADFLAELPGGMRAAFEFRHASWFCEAVFDVLGAAGAARCFAESAELATPPVATADFGYLRLRREDYTRRDLEQWAERVRAERWTSASIYFKHEERGVGPEFAAIMKELLGG